MKIDDGYEDLLAIVDYGDAITTGSKRGAIIGLKDGMITLMNTQRNILLILSCREIKGKASINSRNFPDPVPPLRIAQGEKKTTIYWIEGSFERSAKVLAEKNYCDAIKRVFAKRFHEDCEVILNPENLSVLSSEITNTRLIKQGKNLNLQQRTPTGDEIYDNKLDLAQTDGSALTKFFAQKSSKDKKEHSVLVSTNELMKIAKLTTNNFSLFIGKGLVKGKPKPLCLKTKMKNGELKMMFSPKIREV